jgi:CheY-like chemotaxis protein
MLGFAQCVADKFLQNQFEPSDYKSDSTQPERGKLKILVVDDERLIADTTADVLRGAGFDARAVYDGWTAIETALSFRPDCLLTDVMMPGMNGVELAIAITKMSPDTKILLFSGQAGIADILLHGRAQGHEFQLLAKPIHPLKLIDAVKLSNSSDE